MAKDKNGNALLPAKTPKEIVEWVKNVETYYSVNCLAELSERSSIEEIKAAFDADRNTLIGIGEAISDCAGWDAWESYQHRREFE